MDIQAYFEEWSVKPGDRARMAISTPHAQVRAVLERLVSGPGSRQEQQVRTEPVAGGLDVTVPGRVQKNGTGSYALLPLPAGLADSLTVHCWIWPTVSPRAEPQTVWSFGDAAHALSLALVGGHLEVRLHGRDQPLARSGFTLTPRRWYSVIVAASQDALVLDVALSGGLTDTRRTVQTQAGVVYAQPEQLYLAALSIAPDGFPRAAFNGKIDAPSVYAHALSTEQVGQLHQGRAGAVTALARWDCARDWASEVVALDGGGGGPNGRLFNGVERGVTGHNWDGSSESYLAVPQQYGALQFHEDDLVDCGWAYDLEFDIPADLRSGIYAVRLEAGGAVDRYPLFVRANDAARAPILFLVPTNSYLAYANDHLSAFDFSASMAHAKVVPGDEQELFSSPGLGRSLYDVHADGTPVRYASRRRPLINVRPAFPSWLTDSYRHFPVDLYLVEWLDRVGIDYHVATDEDLERDGAALLERYRVVVTGSHPEYWSGGALHTLRDFLSSTGRLMYLGGNGFYWVTSRFADRPWTIEVRRDNSGTRCWDAPYGERIHASTAEVGGMWRLRGAAPNRLVGVGFASEGWSQAGAYQRTAASYTASGSAFFAGVQAELVGDAGYVLGGAAGDEVDRFDLALGSPAHAQILATSTPLGREYQLVIEDQILALPDQDGVGRPDKVRADMVYFPVEGGGAVFSVGSIVYAGALAWNDFDNDLARVTTNVLRCFATGNLPAEPS